MQKIGDFTSFLSVLLFGVKQGLVSFVYLSFLSYVRHLFCFPSVLATDIDDTRVQVIGDKLHQQRGAWPVEHVGS